MSWEPERFRRAGRESVQNLSSSFDHPNRGNKPFFSIFHEYKKRGEEEEEEEKKKKFGNSAFSLAHRVRPAGIISRLNNCRLGFPSAQVIPLHQLSCILIPDCICHVKGILDL